MRTKIHEWLSHLHWPVHSWRLACVCLIALMLSSCSFIEIHNASSTDLRVLVGVPDSGRSYARFIGKFDSALVFSSRGGRYSVSVVPDEAYKLQLTGLRDTISNRLFAEGATLSAADVQDLMQRLNTVSKDIEALEATAGSCRGSVADFDTAQVTISWHALALQWHVQCS